MRSTLSLDQFNNGDFYFYFFDCNHLKVAENADLFVVKKRSKFNSKKNDQRENEKQLSSQNQQIGKSDSFR